MVSDPEAPSGPREERFAEIIDMLESALRALDELDPCAATGARLQGLIDDLKNGLRG
jgi:hypothetical protein